MVRLVTERGQPVAPTTAGLVVKHDPITPEQVAAAAEAIAAAHIAVESLYDHERYKRAPTLRTMTLRILAADLGESRRQLLEIFSE